jgi:hypothetical protein
MQMVRIVVVMPRVATSGLERLEVIREYLDKLLPFWDDAIGSMADRSPGNLGALLISSDKVLLRLAYHGYIHTLADQRLAPQPARFAASSLTKNGQLWMTSRFPDFDAWAAEKSLIDGVAAVMSIQTVKCPAPEMSE